MHPHQGGVHYKPHPDYFAPPASSGATSSSNSSSSRREKSNVPKSKRRPYTHVACEHCKEKHSKCDGKRPFCAMCIDRGLDCRYREERNRRKKADPNSLGEALIFSSIEREIMGNRRENNQLFSELSFSQDSYSLMQQGLEGYSHQTQHLVSQRPRSQPNLQQLLNDKLAEAQRWKTQYRKMKYKARELGLDIRGSGLDYYSSSSSGEGSFHTNFMSPPSRHYEQSYSTPQSYNQPNQSPNQPYQNHLQFHAQPQQHPGSLPQQPYSQYPQQQQVQGQGPHQPHQTELMQFM